MALSQAENVGIDGRSEPRDEVFCRARATGPDGRGIHLTIVNISPHGLMARCDATLAAGERLRVILPSAGIVVAEIRWSLGGRIGCRLDAAIPGSAYYRLLAMMQSTG
jgi:PilZ domain